MNKEEREFIDTAEEKLHFAKILLEEEGFADSISRSYYSSFNAVKALLASEESYPRTHEGTSSELGKLFKDQIDRALLKRHSQLQTKREDADYTNTDFTKEEAEEAKETAENMLQAAKRILN